MKIRSDGYIDFALEEKGKKRNIVAYINNFLTPPTVLLGSNYLISCPQSLASFYCQFLNLKVSQTPIKVDPIQSKMIWHDRFHYDPAHKWVRETLVRFAEDRLE